MEAIEATKVRLQELGVKLAEAQDLVRLIEKFSPQVCPKCMSPEMGLEMIVGVFPIVPQNPHPGLSWLWRCANCSSERGQGFFGEI